MSNRTLAVGDHWLTEADVHEMALCLTEGGQCLATDGRTLLGATSYSLASKLYALLGRDAQASRTRRLGLSWAREGAYQMAEALRAEMADAMETE